MQRFRCRTGHKHCRIRRENDVSCYAELSAVWKRDAAVGEETDLFVTGCGELAPYEAQFLQADAFITRNVHPDKALIAKTTKLNGHRHTRRGYQGYDLEDLTTAALRWSTARA